MKDEWAGCVGDDSMMKTTIREWLGKCKKALSGPKPGQVFVFRQSGNANLFVTASGRRCLLWSPERGLRWQTKQWFKPRHARVYSNDKEPLEFKLEIRDKSGTLLSEEQVAYIAENQIGILKAGIADHKERLTSEINALETAENVIIGTPSEFVLAVTLLIVLPMIVIGFLRATKRIGGHKGIFPVGM